ncbi:MAG: 50S ribosomal protein L3 [Thermoanaerobaculum sp.]|nr:50S ribosomal protein L3 [Thermoanaerobaculum sp.]MCX7896207.1 50S ribosomal protein L3 [Thermoanaerobaculum sp.]MDW7966760.1 50S ribosomal protein L3 [Thermoanaerobaculum sp.]
MVRGILGRKLGMTQIFDDKGELVPVTVVQAGPCVVVQVKNRAKDGYEAAQIGLVEGKPPRHVGKPLAGHFAKAQVPPTRVLREVPVEGTDQVQPGMTVLCDIFSPGEVVRVVGTSKGKGFQGAVRRHHFRGGAASHGSMFHRAPGSIGPSAFPSRVFPGTRMAGRMGGDTVTLKRVKVIKVDLENNLVFLKGAVPGGRKALVRLLKG